MDQGFDLTFVVRTMIQSVPIWAMVGFAIHHWLNKARDQEEKTLARLAQMEATLQQIQLTLAAMNLAEIRRTIDELKAHKIECEMQMAEIFRALGRVRK